MGKEKQAFQRTRREVFKELDGKTTRGRQQVEKMLGISVEDLKKLMLEIEKGIKD